VKPTKASPEPRVLIHPRINHVNPDGNFTLDIDVSNITSLNPLYSFYINISYDPDVLLFIEAIEGDFLAGQPEGTDALEPVGVAGWQYFGWATHGPYDGLHGNGTLCSVRFYAKVLGESYLNITNPQTELIEMRAVGGGYVPYSILATFENGYFVNTGMLFEMYQQLLDDFDMLTMNYATLLLNYTALLEDQAELMANYTELMGNLTSLQNDYEDLQSDFDALNSTHVSLQSDVYALNSTYNDLLLDYDALQASYDQLQGQYNLLNSTYNTLQASFNELQFDKEAILGEAAIMRDLAYGFLILLVVLASISTFALIRKTKDNN
jgi:hypothetical protein